MGEKLSRVFAINSRRRRRLRGEGAGSRFTMRSLLLLSLNDLMIMIITGAAKAVVVAS